MHAEDMIGTHCQIESRHLDASPPPTFTLRSERLIAAGIDIPNNLDEEIRDLLALALREFGSKA
jgi:hypothetical protein